MLIMTRRAMQDAVGWLRIGGAMARRARQRVVARVPEIDAANRGRMCAHGHRHGRGSRRGNIGRAVTASAILRVDRAGHESLVMAQVAATRNLEYETVFRGRTAVDMAGETRKRGVAGVRKGIGRGPVRGRWCRADRRLLVGHGIALAAMILDRDVAFRSSRRTRRRDAPTKHAVGVKRHRRVEEAPLPDGGVTADTIGGIDARGVRLMTGQALRRDATVILAAVEGVQRCRSVTPDAGRARVGRLGVLVHVMTRPAGPLVGVLLGHVSGRPALHPVTGQALRLGRYQRTVSRVERRQPRKIGAERMARDTTDGGQRRHLAQTHVLVHVATALLAGAVRRNEMMNLGAVALDALKVGKNG